MKKKSALEAMFEAEKPATQPPIQPPVELPVAAPQTVKPAASTAPYIAPSRAGKTAKTHYLPRAYWDTLEEVSFRTRDEQGKRVPQERLVAEALNLLFMHYNYPQVREDDGAA